MRFKARLIRKGNSVRIPRWLLERAEIDGEVEVEAQPGVLMIRRARSAREGWDAQFEAMAKAGDDRLLDGDSLALTGWERSEWEW